QNARCHMLSPAASWVLTSCVQKPEDGLNEPIFVPPEEVVFVPPEEGGLQVQLFRDPSAVGCYRLRAQLEVFRHCLVGVSLTKQAQHFSFAAAEPGWEEGLACRSQGGR